MSVNAITKPAASAQQNAVNTASQQSGTDFKALFSQQLAAEKAAFRETALTPANQLLYAAGGQLALDAKQEYLERQGIKPGQAKEVSGEEDSEAGNKPINNALEVETIKKLMPDGSILVITTQGGKITDQYRKKPHLVEKPDISRPVKIVNGEEEYQTKLVPKQNLFEDMM